MSALIIVVFLCQFGNVFVIDFTNIPAWPYLVGNGCYKLLGLS